jgi:eukaryotic-like serine/threonine-protein kinase
MIGGRFQIIRSLGQGGMGEILLAADVKLGREVAIKGIRADSWRDPDAKARFLREARAAARLDHANIRAIYEIVEEGGREFIVMEYVDGVTLDQLLRMKPLALDRVIAIAAQIADGMAAAQGQRIVHRDIKPGNIMIDRGGRVKILDFGLAMVCPAAGKSEAPDDRGDRELAEKGVVLGTAAYISPEQARGLELDGRSDIFSYGVVLYELIENRNPFAAAEDVVTIHNVLHREVRFQRRVPAALSAIVLKAVQKDREQRYKDFREILKDLLALPARMA